MRDSLGLARALKPKYPEFGKIGKPADSRVADFRIREVKFSQLGEIGNLRDVLIIKVGPHQTKYPETLNAFEVSQSRPVDPRAAQVEEVEFSQPTQVFQSFVRDLGVGQGQLLQVVEAPEAPRPSVRDARPVEVEPGNRPEVARIPTRSASVILVPLRSTTKLSHTKLVTTKSPTVPPSRRIVSTASFSLTILRTFAPTQLIAMLTASVAIRSVLRLN